MITVVVKVKPLKEGSASLDLEPSKAEHIQKGFLRLHCQLRLKVLPAR